VETGSPGLALVWFPVLLVVASAAGGQALRWVRLQAATPLEGFVFAAATGLGLLSYALLAVGLLGAFNRAAFLLLLLAFAVVGAPSVARIARAAGKRRDATEPQRCGDSVIRRVTGETLVAWSAVAVGIYLTGATLLAALAPPGGNDWDGLAYHLAAPKVYLSHGRIHFIPYDSHTNFPFAMEMLYGLGLALGGTPLAKLFHWTAGGLTALAVGAFCGANLGRGEARSPTWVPPLAAVLFLSVPQVAWEATTAYIDLGTALFQFLALYALANGITRWSDGAGKRPAIAWWLVAGGMSGWAMGTKYTALIPFGLLLIAAAAWAWGVSWREARVFPLARAWCLMALLGVVVASPWYIKNVLWTHNPVYPFFYRWFPGSVNWTQEAEDAYRMEQQSFGMGHTPGALVMAPWNTAMEGAAFFTVWSKNARPDSPPRYAGTVLGSVGIALLGLAPLWPFARRVDRRAAWLLAYVGVNFVAWFLLSQQTRYLLPVLAPAGIVAAAVLAALPHGFLRVAASGLIAVSLLVNVIATQRLTLEPVFPVVLGQESRDAYLSRTLPDLYPALQFVNTLPASSRVAFLQEVRGFYADRDYFWANPLQHNLIPYESLPDGKALARFLRERLGITHVLLNRNFARGSEQTNWYRLLEDAAQRGSLVTLYDAHGVAVYEVRSTADG
jgi:4-amino-4-deoxy-L-arabinose transferase-like glycosyltransferase